jgi:hypothetical protein
MSKVSAGAAGINLDNRAQASSLKVESDGKAKAAQARALRERIVRLDPHLVRTVVVPVLVQAVEGPSSPAERQAAARALAQLGPAACGAVPALTARLRVATAPAERRALVLALREIGPSARDAVRDLEVAARARGDSVAGELYQCLQGPEGRTGVKDGGECFSVRALRRSGREIHALAARAQVELMVETAPALRPGAVQEAKQRLGEMGPRGVCVLIGKDGADVRVWATDALRRQGLPTEKLAAAVTDCCRRHDYDGALAEAVRFVAERTKK